MQVSVVNFALEFSIDRFLYGWDDSATSSSAADPMSKLF